MLMLSVGVHVVLFHEHRVRSLTSVFPQLLVGVLAAPFELKRALTLPFTSLGKMPAGWRWLRLAIIPLAIFGLYVSMYRGANPKFDQLTAGFFDGFAEVAWGFFSAIFTAHALFLMLGVITSIIFLFRLAPDFMAAYEAKFKDRMNRVRSKRASWMPMGGMNALEKERRMGIILLVMMNLLLLLVNSIDISWIWFGFEVPENFDLKQFVHAGTWLLILSIAMSVAIMLYLFRKNQNFHPKRRWLQLLSMGWIGQNLILGFSVFLRNYHYINFHGLAAKRIGVVLFLTLVLVGLVTLALKIKQKRTGFNLIILNSWAAFLLLTAASAVDWDRMIVETNLAHSNPAEIDVDHYLEMDPRTFPLLYANLDRVREQIQKHVQKSTHWITYTDIDTFRTILDRKTQHYLIDYEKGGKWAKTDDMHETYQSLVMQQGVLER